MKLIVKVFPEITIKSRPVRMRFIRQLAKNIRAVLRDLDPAVVVNGVWDNLELETRVTDAKALKDMTERLSCMPGIAHSCRSTSTRWATSTTSPKSANSTLAASLKARFFRCAASVPASTRSAPWMWKIRRQQAASRVRRCRNFPQGAAN